MLFLCVSKIQVLNTKSLCGKGLIPLFETADTTLWPRNTSSLYIMSAYEKGMFFSCSSCFVQLNSSFKNELKLCIF